MAMAPPLSYIVLKTRKQPGIGGRWDSPDRIHAEDLSLSNFCDDTGFKPTTDLKLLYDDTQIYGMFRVQDQYVVCREKEYQSDVTHDACVAAYFQPNPESGYLALEMNCCGTLRASYFEEANIEKGGLSGRIVPLPWRDGYQIRIYTSQFGTVESEIVNSITWQLEFVIPFSIFETYTGLLRPIRENPWRANFYKCTTQSSHPHRSSWAPLYNGISFHQPECFSPLYFS
ncbi:MAG: carbohydrate-binding family 9-like protein [Candidatus Hydrogenedentes bacterium]|nr:carbohydrate-binding family 9-like protein [Candidatus Hydrogenedentota bacterium]